MEDKILDTALISKHEKVHMTLHFYVVALCSSQSNCLCFRYPYCLHLEGGMDIKYLLYSTSGTVSFAVCNNSRGYGKGTVA